MDLNRRLDAIDELASMGTEALATLSKAIHHRHPNIREHAVLGLGKVGGDQALRILKDLLDNPESNIVYCAVKALGEMGGDEVTRVLSGFMKREGLESTSAAKALEILAQKGGKDGAEAVIEACSRNYPSYIRLAAISQLPNLSTPRLPEVLEKILQDEDWVIIDHANRALKKFGSQWANEMIERHKKRTTEVKQEWGKKVQEKRQKQVTQVITCVSCKKDFTWNDAYNQQDTPGSHLHNPPGHGNFRPRAFCPHCGFLVAEWDIDRREDRDQWRWHGENASLNNGRELPPSPLTFWGHSLHSEARVTVTQDHIDIKLVRRLEGEALSQEVKKTAAGAERLVPQQVFASAVQELDNNLRSKGGHFNTKNEAFENLKSYIEGEGKLDAKAIALRGIVEYYGGNRDAARAMFNRSVALDESCALSHLGLGILDYLDPKAAQTAIKRLDKAISLESSLVDAYTWKARIQKQRLNDPQGAWNTLQGALSSLGEMRIKKDTWGCFLFEGLGKLCVHDDMGNLNDAIRYFETALESNPNRFEAPMYLMHIYRMLGKSTEAARAQAAYEKADVGIGLTNESINAIRRLVTRAPVLEKPKKRWWPFSKR